MHTKCWIQELKNERIRDINVWLESCSSIGMGGYHLEKLEKNYLTPIDELALLLENKCSEAVIFNTVYYAVNRIFRDIAEELYKVFSVPSYYVAFCANERKETVFLLARRRWQKICFFQRQVYL